MRKILWAAVLGLTVAAVTPAKADTFVWQDPKGDYTLSFPDTWRIQTPDTPSTAIRIAGPLEEDKPVCEMQVQQDGRALIYPKRLVDEAVVHMLDRNFWDDQTNQFDNAKVLSYTAPASLGSKGDASAVHFVYGYRDSPMYGIGLASLYADKRYVMMCTVKMELYDKWSPVFASIMDSVELKTKYHPFAIGYYRDFLADPKFALPRVKPGTVNKNTFVFNDRDFNQ